MLYKVGFCWFSYYWIMKAKTWVNLPKLCFLANWSSSKQWSRPCKCVFRVTILSSRFVCICINQKININIFRSRLVFSCNKGCPRWNTWERSLSQILPFWHSNTQNICLYLQVWLGWKSSINLLALFQLLFLSFYGVTVLEKPGW